MRLVCSNMWFLLNFLFYPMCSIVDQIICSLPLGVGKFIVIMKKDHFQQAFRVYFIVSIWNQLFFLIFSFDCKSLLSPPHWMSIKLIIMSTRSTCLQQELDNHLITQFFELMDFVLVMKRKFAITWINRRTLCFFMIPLDPCWMVVNFFATINSMNKSWVSDYRIFYVWFFDSYWFVSNV